MTGKIPIAYSSSSSGPHPTGVLVHHVLPPKCVLSVTSYILVQLKCPSLRLLDVGLMIFPGAFAGIFPVAEPNKNKTCRHVVCTAICRGSVGPTTSRPWQAVDPYGETLTDMTYNDWLRRLTVVLYMEDTALRWPLWEFHGLHADDMRALSDSPRHIYSCWRCDCQWLGARVCDSLLEGCGFDARDALPPWRRPNL